MSSDFLLVNRHCLFRLRARCICNAKMKCRSTSEPLLPESLKIAWLGKHGGNISLTSSNSGYIWAATPQLLSWETEKDSEKKPRHLNAFQFVKFPIFPVDGERLESLTILLLQIVFYSFVSEFLLRKTCLSYSSSFLFVIGVFLWIRYITFINDFCPHGLPSSFCRKFVSTKADDTFVYTSFCDLPI
jgi:hypothetical protein